MMPGGCHKYIFGLHVTMKVARFVDVVETVNDLTKDGGDEPTSERTASTRLDELE